MPTSEKKMQNSSKLKLQVDSNKDDERSDFSVDENLGEIEGIYVA